MARQRPEGIPAGSESARRDGRGARKYLPSRAKIFALWYFSEGMIGLVRQDREIERSRKLLTGKGGHFAAPE